MSIRLLVAVLITDTVLLPRLATYSRPSGPSANALGEDPTETLRRCSVGVDAFVGGGVDHRYRAAAGVGHIQPLAVGAQRQRAGRVTHRDGSIAEDARVGVDPLCQWQY